MIMLALIMINLSILSFFLCYLIYNKKLYYIIKYKIKDLNVYLESYDYFIEYIFKNFSVDDNFFLQNYQNFPLDFFAHLIFSKEKIYKLCFNKYTKKMKKISSQLEDNFNLFLIFSLKDLDVNVYYSICDLLIKNNIRKAFKIEWYTLKEAVLINSLLKNFNTSRQIKIMKDLMSDSKNISYLIDASDLYKTTQIRPPQKSKNCLFLEQFYSKKYFQKYNKNYNDLSHQQYLFLNDQKVLNYIIKVPKNKQELNYYAHLFDNCLLTYFKKIDSNYCGVVILYEENRAKWVVEIDSYFQIRCVEGFNRKKMSPAEINQLRKSI